VSLGLAMQLGLAGCGGNDLLLPSSGEPAKIEVLRGNGQTATVGQPLGEPVVVKVTDPGNRPVEGAEVVFVIPAGAQIAPNDTVLTNADGEATVSLTLSTVSGAQDVQARATPVVPSLSLTTTITATASPEAAVELVVAGGDGKRGEVSTALAESLSVRAVDRFGNGVKDVEVRWEADGGSVSAASVLTGADGRSAVQRTLGESPGTYTTTASADGLEGSPVGFTNVAVAAPSPALALVTQPSSAASAGVPFAQQPVLQLQDPTGAPLSREDVRVTVGVASGGGSLGGSTSARSDANGRVTFEDLSIRGEPGTRTLIFAAEGFSPATSSPIVVASGPPSLERSSASVPDGTAGAVTSISIRLEDQFGNPVEGGVGLISVTVTGANPLGLPVNEQGNGSYSASYTPIHAGADQVDILVNGSPLDKSPFTSNVVAGPPSPATSTADVPASSSLFVNGTIIVHTRDAQSNLLGRGGETVAIVFVHRDSGTRIDDRAQIRDNGDGTYTANYSQPGLGTFDVEITLNGSPILGSPYQTIVGLF
jgi:hypothetical protein